MRQRAQRRGINKKSFSFTIAFKKRQQEKKDKCGIVAD
jgi:hypothetical protein